MKKRPWAFFISRYFPGFENTFFAVLFILFNSASASSAFRQFWGHPTSP
jgi:hypothetical protein